MTLESRIAKLVSNIKAAFSGIIVNDPTEDYVIQAESCGNSGWEEDTSGPCVLGKKYFTHLRRWVWSENKCEVELSNFGGATLCWVVEKTSQEGKYYFFYTWADCSLKPDVVTKRPDQFCKKTGRLLCLEHFTKWSKLQTEQRNRLLTVNEARQYVIQQYKICKSKYYKQVWTEYQ